MDKKFAYTALLLAALPLPAPAAMDYFLKIDGIEGESLDKAHKGEIDVLSWAWGTSRTGGSTVFDPLSWEQGLDKSFVPLFLGLANDTTFSSALLTARRVDANGSVDFFKMLLEDAKVVSVSSSASEDEIVVSAAMSYESITMTYYPQDPKGGLGSPVVGSFNIVNNKVAFSGDPNVLAGMVEAGGTLDFVSAVPEPQSWVLFAAGLGIVGVLLRRRRQSDRAAAPLPIASPPGG